MAINLSKGQKINLQKINKELGEILINLNWNAGVINGEGIDLDLGCLYELKDGRKSTVQALGKKFGSYSNPPFITLDGDDRTGENSDGENLRINGKQISQIKRVLVYTFIYEGVTNWQQADAMVTIKNPGSEDILIKMDEYNNSNRMCALAMFENVNDETFSVQKLIQFYQGHADMDLSYNWGLSWRKGKK